MLRMTGRKWQADGGWQADRQNATVGLKVNMAVNSWYFEKGLLFVET